MKKCSLFVFAVSLTVTFSSLSCSDSESKLKPLPAGQTAVIINLNLPPENPTASDNSIWNKIRSFFIKDAVAQTAPANFSSISVTVTGADMSAVQQTFSPSPMITVNAPAGNARRFDILANVAPGDPSAALSFSGTATADLAEGTVVDLPITMALNETKIVVPDSANCGGCGTSRRIIMIENLSTAAATWTPKTTFPGFTGTLFPMDISFDSRGRIYIANNSTIGVIRIDDINGTNLIQGSPTVYGTGTPINNVVTIAVDRINNILYFATASALYKSPLNGSSLATQLTLAIPGGNFIRGIDVDNTGMLYIVAVPSSAGQSFLFKYDPNAPGIVGTPYPFGSSAAIPIDVLFRSPYIYVTNFSSISAGTQILQLTFSGSAFSLVTGNGTKTATVGDTATGRFYGASRFLAIRNDVFIVADSDQSTTTGDKLVSFSDMLFTNWTTYGNYVAGIPSAAGEFKLYSTC